MFKYDANDIMRLLRKQNLAEPGDIEPYFMSEIKDIMTANGIPDKWIDNKMLMLGIDIVQYGVILGKRIERRRNKSKYGLSERQRDANEKSNQINEEYRDSIRKLIEQTEDTHALCCTYTTILTHLKILAEKGSAV